MTKTASAPVPVISARRRQKLRNEAATVAQSAPGCTVSTASGGRQRPKGAVTSQPSLPKTAKGERRRSQLIAAVGAALNRRGFRDLGVTDIVAQAGAPVGLFYRYFRSKTEIVVAALEALVEGFRATLPSSEGEGPFFERLCISHQRLFCLFAEQPGLLGCYYSVDYGEPAFSSLLHNHTLRFDKDSILHALRAAHDPHVDPDELIPLAHALTSMIDNFAFRYSTGRDETSRLEKAAKIDLARLTALLRYRGLLLGNPPAEDALAAFSAHRSRSKPGSPYHEPLEPPLAPVVRPRRSPKRSDSTYTFALLKSVGLQLLNRFSYDDMRISDIEYESNTTRGSIYHYFGEKRDLVLQLLAERLEAIQLEMTLCQQHYTADRALRSDLFAELSAVIGVFVREYHQNPGILRAVYQLEERERDIAELILAYRRHWAASLVAMLCRFLVSPVQRHHQLEIIAYAMLAMIERFCYDIYVTPVGELSGRFAKPMDAINLLATVWFRILALRNPRKTVPDLYPALALMSAPESRAHAAKRVGRARKSSKR